MNELNFIIPPEAVTKLFDKLNNIERLLEQKGNGTQPIGDQLLTIEEAAQVLHLTVPTVYGLVHRKEVPVMKKGKRLYFSREELALYIKSGRKKTVAELTTEAETVFHNANKKK